MSYSQNSTNNLISFGNNNAYATLAAGWETASQKAMREDTLVVPAKMLPYAIWIDLINQNIIRCPWSGSQHFAYPVVPAQQSTSMVPPQQSTSMVPPQQQQQS